MIAVVDTWMDIPKERSVASFEDIDTLFKEMKPLLEKSIDKKYRSAYGLTWYEKRILKTGLYGEYIPDLGEWFFDSLIAVNEILRKEGQEGEKRIFNPALGMARYGAGQLHRVYGHCYQTIHPNSYHWDLCISFWKDKEHTDLAMGYDVTEMITSGWWPSIVREFGLFPPVKEGGKNV